MNIHHIFYNPNTILIFSSCMIWLIYCLQKYKGKKIKKNYFINWKILPLNIAKSWCLHASLVIPRFRARTHPFLKLTTKPTHSTSKHIAWLVWMHQILLVLSQIQTELSELIWSYLSLCFSTFLCISWGRPEFLQVFSL